MGRVAVAKIVVQALTLTVVQAITLTASLGALAQTAAKPETPGQTKADEDVRRGGAPG